MAESGHDRCNIGKDDFKAKEVETQAGDSAACAELDSPLVTEVQEVGVGRGRRREGAVVENPSLDELDEDEGARPDGSAHVEGLVVLLEGQHRAVDRQLHGG